MVTEAASGTMLRVTFCLGNHSLGVSTTTKVLLGVAANEGNVKPERLSNEYSQVLIGAGKEGV
jgi:hypothetical protein